MDLIKTLESLQRREETRSQRSIHFPLLISQIVCLNNTPNLFNYVYFFQVLIPCVYKLYTFDNNNILISFSWVFCKSNHPKSIYKRKGGGGGGEEEIGVIRTEG